MRKTLKFFHTLSSCGIVGALFGYAVLLSFGPQDTVEKYAVLRQSISDICNYLLVPSLAIALVTGLFSMAIHRPFQGLRWVWVKALMGLSMFEGTLGVVGSKADYAATISARIADGTAPANALDEALTYEWSALGVILMLSLANIMLGVWRPSLKSRKPASTHR